MPLPEFTAQEQYLINYVKSQTNWAGNAYMWSYIVTGTVIAVFGAMHESVAMMACAFAAVCGLRIYEEFQGRKYLPIWRSLIEKFEIAAK